MANKWLPYAVSGLIGLLGVGANIASSLILNGQVDNLNRSINETADSAVRQIGEAYMKGGRQEEDE